MDLLTDRIKEDMKASMKGGAKARLGVIRLILAAVKQVELMSVFSLIMNGLFWCLIRCSSSAVNPLDFLDAGRHDLVGIEEAEVLVIQDFLPQALSEEEVDVMVADAVIESGAESIKDMGKVMNLLKPNMQGRADMSVVSIKIKAALNG